MSLVPKEILLSHLQRAEGAEEVTLPIDFFRDLLYQSMPRTWQDLIDEAVKAEREACAKLVEDSWMAFSRTPNRRLDITPFPELEYVAKVIRARGQA